ncbi:MAG: Gfo/Idh/MocA family oxidoreductase [Sediminibacterium sp.]|nr:Gfo/Idh/MocA family oxidoreductase [Sediminibacterium sp.]
MSNKINIGVLGCADIAERLMIPSIVGLNQYFNLVGIASRNKDKAIKFAENFNTKAYDGYDELLNDPLLDAVYIPLPNALHTEWIEKALCSEVHVIVEKSLGCDYDEVLKINELAKSRSLVLLENFQFRFHSQLAFIKNMLEEGIIGELRCMRSSFGFPPFPDENNIRYKKELGGGALLDVGAYPLKLSQIILGYDLEIKASTLVYDKGKGVDIWGGAFLKQTNGVLFSEIAFGFDNYYQCNIELWGSKGKIYSNRIFTAPIGYEPVIELETAAGKETIKIPADQHFRNILIHFYDLIISKNGLENEYLQNINQAKLIAELKNMSNG